MRLRRKTDDKDAGIRIGKYYFRRELSSQVFNLVDSTYTGGPEYSALIESFSYPVLIKAKVSPSDKETTSRRLARLLADRKSELRYSRTMGESERDRIKKQVSDLQVMSSRIGEGKASLINLSVSYRISSVHPVKLRESSSAFKSVMSLMGFRLKLMDYTRPSVFRKIISPFLNTGPEYPMDTISASSFLPIVSTPIPDREGIFIGVDDMTEKPVKVDVFGKSSHNSLIFGETGSGKSFFSKLFLMRYLATGGADRVTVVDPLDEYSCSMFEVGCSEIAGFESSNSCIYSDPPQVVIHKITDLMESGNQIEIEKVIKNIYNRMSSDDNSRKIILLDEAHLFLNNRSSLEVLSRMIRHSRHYNASVVCITQNVDDLSKNQFSNVIAENSSSVFIFRTRSVSQADRSRFGLNRFSDWSTEDLMGGKTSPYSECLFMENGELKKVRIIGTKLEAEMSDHGKK